MTLAEKRRFGKVETVVLQYGRERLRYSFHRSGVRPVAAGYS